MAKMPDAVVVALEYAAKGFLGGVYADANGKLWQVHHVQVGKDLATLEWIVELHLGALAVQSDGVTADSLCALDGWEG